MDTENNENGIIDNRADMGHLTEMDNKYDNTQPYYENKKLIVLMRTSQSVQFKSLLECLKELLDEVKYENDYT